MNEVGDSVGGSPDLLLTTKLFVPSPASGLVSRPHLAARLDEGLNDRLTTVIAPAGWGKTTVLSAWCADLLSREPAANGRGSHGPPAVRVAWVSLDAADADLTRFWTYVITALDNLYTGAGKTALSLLRSPRPPTIETVLTTLVNELASLNSNASSGAVLILDDYHLIDAQPVHSALTFLLENLPPHLHLVIASRTDPPLPLARLRARGTLSELRAGDLRFTPEEAAVFLREIMGLHLSAQDVAALDERTEGWIAGLQLAALAMRDRADITGFIAGFTGSSRFIIDYLAEEVLERQPDEIKTFLLRTSILERICAPLCDAMLHTGAGSEEPATPVPSQEMLEKLERSNLFIIALDDERVWYRYHHLFADVLRARLRQTRPDLPPVLYRHAADWCESEGFVTEALRYALSGGDHDQAARIVEARAQSVLFNRGDFATVRGWFAILPEALILSRPRLCLDCAAAIVITGDLATVERYLQAAEKSLPAFPDAASDLQAAITALRGYIAIVQLSNWEPGRDLLQTALAALPSDHAYKGLVLFSLGRLYFHTAPRSSAIQVFTEAVDFNRRYGYTMMTISALNGVAACQALQGKLHEAAATCREGLLLAESQGIHMVVTAADLHARLSMYHYEWNDLDKALQYALAAQQIALAGDYRIVLSTVLAVTAQILNAKGDPDGAMSAMIQNEQLVIQRTDNRQFKARVAAGHVRRRLATTTGTLAGKQPLSHDLEWAHELGLSANDEPSIEYEMEYLALARLLLENADRRAEGLRLLARLLTVEEAIGSDGLVISILALQAMGLASDGNQAPALESLQRALFLAESQGYIRTFVDEGPPMEALLRLAKKHAIAPEYVDRLLNHFAPGINQPHAKPSISTAENYLEPLTARELEVLHLVAQGASNRQIAKALIVTLGTVKRHTNNVYGKLGVGSRTQAVARAHELHLL